MDDKLDQVVDRELKIVDFWEKNKIFERSITSRPRDKHYVFYDGPPFATGLPHSGHLLGSTLKDVIPRYFTMKGYRVERIWVGTVTDYRLKISSRRNFRFKEVRRGLRV